ncbi:uncharacterized protein [Acropora muricata]|uniref:uncharacterized protein n=1 Tax=Acropora muricata TaxID=159855 RepID=UPI0034E417F0
MSELDPQSLEARGNVGAKRQRKKGNFTTRGSNWVHSLDGHDKLMGYQNSTFPLAVYGCMDTATRKLLWLKVWVSNPKFIGRWYLKHLYGTKIISAMLRVDKGTETEPRATMHAFLRRHHNDMDPHETVIYGPSTSNQIERWWNELHERMERYFKDGLRWLNDQGHYDPHNDSDRLLLAFIMVPLIQKELAIFREIVCNSHTIRAQRHTALPDRIPDHIYNYPEKYGLEESGLPVTEEQLQEVAIESGVLRIPDDFLTLEFREECERIIPDNDTIKPDEWKDA